MSTVSVSVNGSNYALYTPQLQGQRLSLTLDSNGVAGLWLEDSQLMQVTNTGSGASVSVTLGATHPYGGWDTSINAPIDNGAFDAAVATNYQRVNADYAFRFGFQARSQRLAKSPPKIKLY